MAPSVVSRLLAPWQFFPRAELLPLISNESLSILFSPGSLLHHRTKCQEFKGPKAQEELMGYRGHRAEPIKHYRAFLVVQWLRIHLAMQETDLIPVQEDRTCHRATKPSHHKYGALILQLLKPEHLEPVPHKSSPRPSQLEKAHTQQRPSATNNK